MKIRTFLFGPVLLALTAVLPCTIALGDPPVKQPITPGITAPQSL
jgi:hypothetical protein